MNVRTSSRLDRRAGGKPIGMLELCADLKSSFLFEVTMHA